MPVVSSTDLQSLHRRLLEAELSELERALVILHVREDPLQPMTAAEIATVLESAGAPKINASRLAERLDRDRRCGKSGKGYRIRPSERAKIDSLAAPLIGPSRPPVSTEFLDSGIFADSPKYVRETVAQINVCFQEACLDACSVMVRRLAETLIIEAFEHQNCLDEIRDAQGELLTLKALIDKIKTTRSFTLSRQTKNALPYLKNIGDWSAHNRRHLARASDLENVQQHLRLASSDLLHLAGFVR